MNCYYMNKLFDSAFFYVCILSQNKGRDIKILLRKWYVDPNSNPKTETKLAQNNTKSVPPPLSLSPLPRWL